MAVELLGVPEADDLALYVAADLRGVGARLEGEGRKPVHQVSHLDAVELGRDHGNGPAVFHPAHDESTGGTHDRTHAANDLDGAISDELVSDRDSGVVIQLDAKAVEGLRRQHGVLFFEDLVEVLDPGRGAERTPR